MSPIGDAEILLREPHAMVSTTLVPCPEIGAGAALEALAMVGQPAPPARDRVAAGGDRRPAIRLVRAGRIAPGPSGRDAVQRFFDGLAAPDLRLRFGGLMPRHDPALLWRLFGFGDPRQEILVTLDAAGDVVAIGNLATIDPMAAEVALAVRSDLQRRGIGTALLGQVVRRARELRLSRLHAYLLQENGAACRLVRRAGFRPVGPLGIALQACLALDGPA